MISPARSVADELLMEDSVDVSGRRPERLAVVVDGELVSFKSDFTLVVLSFMMLFESSASVDTTVVVEVIKLSDGSDICWDDKVVLSFTNVNKALAEVEVSVVLTIVDDSSGLELTVEALDVFAVAPSCDEGVTELNGGVEDIDISDEPAESAGDGGSDEGDKAVDVSI